MLSKVFSAVIVGLDARIIEVEVDTSFGLQHFSIVGLPDKSVEESKERMASAIKSTQFEHPYKKSRRILVNLAPAELKKQGSLYDLPIALGFLSASEQLEFDYKNKIFIGELALDGTLRPVKGALSFALEAQKQGFSEIILPKANAPEASLISIFSEKSNKNKLKVIGANSLKETIDYLTGRKQIHGFEVNINDYFEKTDNSTNLAFIKGQNNAKRVMEIAAAGNHNVLKLWTASQQFVKV